MADLLAGQMTRFGRGDSPGLQMTNTLILIFARRVKSKAGISQNCRPIMLPRSNVTADIGIYYSQNEAFISGETSFLLVLAQISNILRDDYGPLRER